MSVRSLFSRFSTKMTAVIRCNKYLKPYMYLWIISNYYTLFIKIKLKTLFLIRRKNKFQNIKYLDLRIQLSLIIYCRGGQTFICWRRHFCKSCMVGGNFYFANIFSWLFCTLISCSKLRNLWIVLELILY